jgi:hypothetical protein
MNSAYPYLFSGNNILHENGKNRAEPLHYLLPELTDDYNEKLRSYLKKNISACSKY